MLTSLVRVCGPIVEYFIAELCRRIADAVLAWLDETLKPRTAGA